MDEAPLAGRPPKVWGETLGGMNRPASEWIPQGVGIGPPQDGDLWGYG